MRETPVKIKSQQGRAKPIFLVLGDVSAWWLRQMADVPPVRLWRWRGVPVNALTVSPGSMENSATETVTLSARRRRCEQDMVRLRCYEPGLEALRRSLGAAGQLC